MISTPFEASGGTTWTTIPQAEDFLTQVELSVSSGRSMTRTVLGKAVDSVSDIEIVHMSTSSTPADAPSVLIIACQHGNEPAGREMALQTIRDFLTGDDPTLSAVLDGFHVRIIHTASPVGYAANTRNISGVNPNREHLGFSVPEPKLIQQAITTFDPFLIVDAHEHFSPAESDNRFLMGPNRSTSDSGIYAASIDLMGAIQGRFDSLSIDHGVYPSGSDQTTFSAVASLRNRVFSLFESPARAEFAVPPQVRVDWQIIARDAVFSWMLESGHAAAAEVAAANQRDREATTLDLGAGFINPPPVAYRMPAPVPEQVEVFGLEHTVDDGVVTVALAQPSRMLIANLFDPEASDRILTGERVIPMVDNPFENIRVQVDGHRVMPIGMKARIDGQTIDILNIRFPETA